MQLAEIEKLKAGDRVRLKSGAEVTVGGRHDKVVYVFSPNTFSEMDGRPWQSVFTIKEALDAAALVGQYYSYIYENDNKNSKIKHADVTLVNSYSSNHSTMNIVDFIKRVGLTAADKALLDAGLEDPTGVPTALGIDVMNKLQWQGKPATRADIAALAQEMVDEAKAAAKK